MDRAGNLVPTFPKATYYVQRSCWEDACNPNERCFSTHRQENFIPLEERDQLRLILGGAPVLEKVLVAVLPAAHTPVARQNLPEEGLKGVVRKIRESAG